MRPHDHTLHSTVNHKVHSDAIETNNVYREREREKESDEKCLDVEHEPIGPNGKIALAWENRIFSFLEHFNKIHIFHRRQLIWNHVKYYPRVKVLFCCLLSLHQNDRYLGIFTEYNVYSNTKRFYHYTVSVHRNVQFATSMVLFSSPLPHGVWTSCIRFDNEFEAAIWICMAVAISN